MNTLLIMRAPPLCASAGSPTAEMEGSDTLSLSLQQQAWNVDHQMLSPWTWSLGRTGPKTGMMAVAFPEEARESREGCLEHQQGGDCTQALTELTMAGPGCVSCYQGFWILAGSPFSARNL